MSNVVHLNVRRVAQTQNQSPYEQILSLVVDFDEQTAAIIRELRKTNSYAADVLAHASIDARYHLTQAAEAVFHGE